MTTVLEVSSIQPQVALGPDKEFDLRSRRQMVAQAYRALGRRQLPAVDAITIGYAAIETLESMATKGTIVDVAVQALYDLGDVQIMPTMASVMTGLDLSKHLFNRTFGNLCNGPRMDGNTVASKFATLIG